MVNTIKSKLMNRSTIDMTSGDVRKTLLIFAFPLLIGNLFQQFYNMVDTMVVGRFMGTNALASVGASSPIIQLLLGLTIGLAGGLSVVIAQKFGSGDIRKTQRSIINGLYLIIIVSVIITILGIFLSRPLFELINTPITIIDGATTYTIILFMGTITTALYNYEAGVLRALGNSMISLLFLIISSILNVVLDVLFVVSFNWGIAGVAIATVLSQLISCLLCFIYMRRNFEILHFKNEDLAFNHSLVKEHIKIGMPMAFFQSFLSVSFLLVQSALNTLGSNEIAAYTAAYKMDSLMMQILAAFGSAISTFTAQNYGKNQFERIHKGARSCIKITITLSIIISLLVYFFGKYFMLLFVGANESNVISLGVQYLKITSLCYIILGVNFVIRFVLTGVGKTSIPVIVGILEIVIRGLATYYLIYPLGYKGMALTNPLCWGTSTLLVAILYPKMIKDAEQMKLKNVITKTK